MKYFEHKKSGEIYIKVGEATNTTNKDDGDNMIIYVSAEDWCLTFVREEKEFYDKFTELE